MPLFFQAVLLDSASVAGLRLVAPSLATLLGGLTTGLVMRRGDRLTGLTRCGLALLALGSCLNLLFGMHEPLWKYSVYLMVGSFGQGAAYPSTLFGFLRACDAKGESGFIPELGDAIDTLIRTCRGHLASLPPSVHGCTLGHRSRLDRYANCSSLEIIERVSGNSGRR